MSEQLLLLVRVSKPEYNRTLYNDYTLYMNPQMAFKNDVLTDGQRDDLEGAISTIPGQLLYSDDGKKHGNCFAI